MRRVVLCNWKMYFSHEQSNEWIKTHGNNVNQLARDSKHPITIFPSMDACAELAFATKYFSFSIGAQDCAPDPAGAFTGQVQAASLEQMGCTHCIIGHSETREAYNLTNQDIAQRLKQLNTENIIPVICIGEPESVYKKNETKGFIEQQLKPLIQHFQLEKTYYVAYEPIWAIGTGTVPDNEYIAEIATHIKNSIKPTPISVLYGGSVHSDNIKQLAKIKEINGFLIGKASTDFQELKKIVTLL